MSYFIVKSFVYVSGSCRNDDTDFPVIQLVTFRLLTGFDLIQF